MIKTPLYSRVMEQSEPLPAGVYVCGHIEERSRALLAQAGSNVEIAVLKEPTDTQFSVGESGALQQKTIQNYSQLCKSFTGKFVHLDITGLSHSVWAPLVKCFLELQINFHVIYVEPEEYKKHLQPVGGEIYDLSEKINGIAPIPGLASLPAEESDFIFIPLLGFEGARFSFMVEKIEPIGSRTFPIIGVPGFKADYPFLTYFGNRLSLKSTGAWKNVRYVPAHCPFSLFMEIEKLLTKYRPSTVKIGLIGTKPHALGAVMLRLAYPDKIELVYDHPVRKAARTSGSATRHILDVATFFKMSTDHSSLVEQARRLR